MSLAEIVGTFLIGFGAGCVFMALMWALASKAAEEGPQQTTVEALQRKRNAGYVGGRRA